MQPRIFLFDVDGVLVQPGGYRTALRATVNYMTNKLGLGDLAPDDETVEIFEAQGITCEWDMVPALLAVIIDCAAAGVPQDVRLDSFEAVQDWFSRWPPDALRVDFAPALRRMGSYVEVGRAPSDTILAACQNGQAAALFPNLAGQGLLAELFGHTRSLRISRTTALFEIFAVGDRMYAQTTGLLPETRSESLLERYDQPLLAPAVRERLLTLRQENRLRFAAYTARPSQPADQPEELLACYAPEAEMALGQLGIDPFPLMGSGQMCAAAARLGKNSERLIKPSPYHALAAAAAAWTGDGLVALAWIERVFSTVERQAQPAPRPALKMPSAPLPARLQLHIFEDSPAGMHGGKQAAQILAELGVQVDLRLWGVAKNPEKVAALHAAGAQIFPDVNQAVTAALE